MADNDPADATIDPSDSLQIGMLVGLAGGTIADAAVVRLALERFEATYGRKATMREAGTVVALMKAVAAGAR